MRIAYFTGGTVGAGHTMRGLAIQRALARAAVRVDYRMFSCPNAIRAFDAVEARTIVDFDAAELASAGSARDTALARSLAEFAPDLLIVDMFWAPLRWLLPLAGTEVWLLLRACPPEWLSGPPGVPFDPGQFARIFGIEPSFVPEARERTEPIVVANPDECLPPNALREHFQVPEGERLTIVVHAGRRGEIDRLRLGGEDGRVIVMDLYQEGALFPIAPWLKGADRIAGYAGYNLFWETRWLGLKDRSHLVPAERTIDDQLSRILRCSSYVPKENGADQLVRAIVRSVSPQPVGLGAR